MPLGNFLESLLRALRKVAKPSDNTLGLSAVTVQIPTTYERSSSDHTNDQSSIPPVEVRPNTIGKIMINISMLQDELQNFVSGSAEVQGAMLASPDGLALASVLPVGMDDERTAAMSASMLSLGERIGRELARGAVDRIVVEGEKGYGVLVGCSDEAVLLVLASSVVKQGLLFLEIKRAVSRIAALLG